MTQNKPDRMFAITPRDDASPPVEQHACDHEHGRNGQHVRKSFRGRPLGGLFHAVYSLNPGTTYRCVKHTQDRQNLLGTPLDEYPRI